jgi:acetyltransferase-like isoleucine patch superfamily enzyme
LTNPAQSVTLCAMTEQREILDIQEKMSDAKTSAIQKYQNLVIGQPGFLALARHEFIHTFISGIPGALGLVLRRMLYPFLLGRMGKNVAIGSHVTFRHPHKVFIGDNVVIDDNCLIDAKGDSNKGIVIGSGVFIGRNSILHCKNGDIVIGDNANIGFNCDIASSNMVEIGEKVLIAAYAYIVGGGHDFSKTDVPIMDQKRVAKGIRINAHSWIGAGVTVLDGVTVGEGAIVGTGAVVNNDLPANTISVGMPAKVIRQRDTASDQ